MARPKDKKSIADDYYLPEHVDLISRSLNLDKYDRNILASYESNDSETIRFAIRSGLAEDYENSDEKSRYIELFALQQAIEDMDKKIEMELEIELEMKNEMKNRDTKVVEARKYAEKKFKELRLELDHNKSNRSKRTKHTIKDIGDNTSKRLTEIKPLLYNPTEYEENWENVKTKDAEKAKDSGRFYGLEPMSLVVAIVLCVGIKAWLMPVGATLAYYFSDTNLISLIIFTSIYFAWMRFAKKPILVKTSRYAQLNTGYRIIYWIMQTWGWALVSLCGLYIALSVTYGVAKPM